MYCMKCGAVNKEEDIFCTSCGAVLTGVSLDDYEEQAAPARVSVEQPVAEPAYEQPVPTRRPARAPQERNPAPGQQSKRRKRNPQGLEFGPIAAAALALICLLLPWFKLTIPLGSKSVSLFKAFFSYLGEIGKLGFWDFLALAMFLVLIVSPVLIAYFAWRRENNYMGISCAAVICSFFAWLFTSLATKSGISSELRKLIKVSANVGFYLYILCIIAAVGIGVYLSMQRQKKRRRPRAQ